MFCLKSKCEIAVVGREVFTKVCWWKHIWMEDTFPVRGTHRMIHWKGHNFLCEERLVQIEIVGLSK